MREQRGSGFLVGVPPECYRPTADLWVYSHRSDSHEYHRIIAQSPLSGHTDGYQVLFHTACGADRRHAETSLEPPADLELCVVCALGDFDAWVVYCCLDDNGIPLYVGCTYDLVTRLNAHSNRTRNQLSERWWPLVDRVEADVYFDSDEAFEAERAAIRSLSPRFNTLHNRGRAVAA